MVNIKEHKKKTKPKQIKIKEIQIKTNIKK